MGGALILAADVGGTKTYVGFFDSAEKGYEPLVEARVSTADHSSLGVLLAAFAQEAGLTPDRVAVGVPGPVRHLPVRAVNLPWLIDPAEMRAALGLDQVHLLNDLEATAYGTLVLPPEDTVTLNEGRSDPEGNIAVIAAGTGLGEGGLCWSGRHYVTIASEGGHTDFSPGNASEAELFLYLRKRFDHVSWERVVSGPGLVQLYEFLRDSGRFDEPGWLSRELEQGDPSQIISRVAMEGRCDLAMQALDHFVSLYGAEAGNLALKMLATGGVFVGGGIAPKIIDKLQGGRFMEAFLAKGRLAQPLQDMPVKVILNDKTAFLGAAYWGSHHA